MTKDCLIHYQLFDYRMRAAVAIVTGVTREAMTRHELDPLTTIAVGRAIGCAALLASTLKQGPEYVHCAFTGQGVLRKVIGECSGDGDCRGYALPTQIHKLLPAGSPVPESVGAAMGGGLLTVVRGTAGDREPYRAVSELANGEIATDVARYLTDSEQIPSAVAAGVKLDHDGAVLGAGAILVQKMGGVDLDERLLAQVEEHLRDRLALSERIAAGEDPDQLIAGMVGGGSFGRLTVRDLRFKCTCSRDRMASMLGALGEARLAEIEAETGQLEVRCQYCGATHRFRHEELIIH